MATGNGRTTNEPVRRYTKADWTDFVHTGPGTLAGRYMRMFWQPVYRAEDLPTGRAKPIRIMSEDFTLYRGEGGTPHLLAFRCAHRGTQLSVGWVEGDNIRCFYHGWMYDGSGQCVEQPAEPEPFCQKIRIRSYPTKEYLGLIFAYLGEGEAPPLPRYPDFEQEGIRTASASRQACNYFVNLENDPTHVPFVHSGGLVRPIPKVAAEESPWGLTKYANYPDGTLHAIQQGMPNILHVQSPPYDDTSGWRNSLHWSVPVDEESNAGFGVEFLQLTGEAAARYQSRPRGWLSPQAINEYTRAVLAGDMRIADIDRKYGNVSRVEDNVAYIGLGAIPDRSRDHLGPVDIVVLTLRKIWSRELRALAEGRPLKLWGRGPELQATEGVWAGHRRNPASR